MNITSFMERVYPEPNTGCWFWTGRTNRDGYGQLHAEDNEFRANTAHRFSYLYHKGSLNGLQVLHTCDVRCCVNPDHLFMGTQVENIADMVSKNRHRKPVGEKSKKAKITQSQATEIKRLYSTGLYIQKDIAKLYNV